MKHKILIAIVGLALVGTWFMNRSQQKQEVTGTSKQTHALAIPSQAQAPVEMARIPQPTASATPVPHDSRLREKVKTLEELHREYVNYKTYELLKVLEWSKARLNDSGLVEKSNRTSLSDKEVYVLLTEIRRQGAIYHILTERELEKAERMSL